MFPAGNRHFFRQCTRQSWAIYGSRTHPPIHIDELSTRICDRRQGFIGSVILSGTLYVSTSPVTGRAATSSRFFFTVGPLRLRMTQLTTRLPVYKGNHCRHRSAPQHYLFLLALSALQYCTCLLFSLSGICRLRHLKGSRCRRQ